MEFTHVSSSTNTHVKHVRRLAREAKYRAKSGQTVLEGMHLAQAYIANGYVPQLVLVAKSALDANSALSQMLQEVKEQTGIVVSDALFAQISALDAAEPSVMFVISPSTPAAKPLDSDALLLDRVQDPGNVGTMLRTAAAAGITRVYMSRGSVRAWSPKVLRAGQGAHVTLDIYEDVDLAEAICNAHVPVLATSLDAHATIYEYDLRAPSAWLFGNEGAGVSTELLALCKEKVIIPQYAKIESLNVAAAMAVCLFEQQRQRRAP